MQYTTIKTQPVKEGAIILVDTGPNQYERYVTGWLGEEAQSWCWGHYFRALDDAATDFQNRVARGY